MFSYSVRIACVMCNSFQHCKRCYIIREKPLTIDTNAISMKIHPNPFYVLTGRRRRRRPWSARRRRAHVCARASCSTGARCVVRCVRRTRGRQASCRPTRCDRHCGDTTSTWVRRTSARCWRLAVTRAATAATPAAAASTTTPSSRGSSSTAESRFVPRDSWT